MKLQLLKKTAIAAALAAFSMAASAMTPMQDESLSQVSGQDGVSIAANLNVNVGSFVYTDTDANGGSVSFNNVLTTGLIAANLDVINAATFNGILTASGVTFPTTMYDGLSDVVQIEIPQSIVVPTAALMDVSVASIQMGNSAASYGSFAMNNIDLRGTSAWIWAH